ncbi:MAG TPA: DUF4197 domain-containing protein [Allosphingosinicella sp.]|jgi:hypothetical protein
MPDQSGMTGVETSCKTGRYPLMTPSFSRRGLVAAGLVLPLLTVPGCMTRLGDVPNLEPAIRRLLTLSSQRAFARLLTDEGFFRDDIARIQPPPQLGGSTITATLAVALGTRAVQDRLIRVVNRAAEEGARRAAPAIYDSIRDMTITDALAIARGGPTAATDYLARSMGERIFDALFPGVGEALRLAENGVIQRALQFATAINFPGLQADVTRKTAAALYRAIGREEAAIRADPGSAGDPALAVLFGRR